MSKSELKKHGFIIALICFVIVLFSVLLFVFEIFKQDNVQSIPIVGFHNIVHDDEKEQYFKHDIWVSSLSSFEEQMKYLSDHNYHTITLDELHAWRIGKYELDDKAVVLTFDDGYLATSELIEPILAKYNFEGACFVIGSILEQEPQVWDGSKLQYISKDITHTSGAIRYFSHTYDLHYKDSSGFSIDNRNKQELTYDFELQSNLVSCDYVAYPYGHYNALVQDVLYENAVKLAFGYHENRKAKRTDSLYALPRFAVTSYTTLDVFKAMLEA